MKQTFTLLAAFACSILSAFGQSTQGFETDNLTTLRGSCWQFTGMDIADPGIVNDTKSLYNNLNVTASVITPYINLSAGTTLSFNYRLAGVIRNAAKRYINVSLIDINGAITSIGSVQLDKTTPDGVLPFSYQYTSVTSSVQKLRIELTTGAEGKTDVHLDNIATTSTFNTSGLYNCNASAPITLPIQLKSFQGLVVADKAQLTWTVADNASGSHFEVERSLDGKDFTTIALVNPTTATGDESYSYKDNAPEAAYYRLRVVNTTKAVSYSNVVFLKRQGAASTSISLLQNPVETTLRFSFVSGSTAPTEVAVYNMTGVKVFHTSLQALKGLNTLTSTLDGSIQSGTYVLEVTNKTTRSVAKFVKH
jgi:hypothetical protein